MFKKIISGFLVLALALGSAALSAAADSYTADYKSVTDYTYKITPLLSPFNEYFFIETDNPDPMSFRFADKSSVYGDDANITFNWDDWNDEVILYADIKYENKETGRVNGGYIFKSFNTDGGEVILQSKNDAYYSWDVTWSDTNITLKLPALKDDIDYLIDTYATKLSFFDNMDAVQEKFSNICLYSGSSIRGPLEKRCDYWMTAIAGHIDQSFYIYSPYARKDSEKLFATAIYPYRYDSLGFPSVMGTISERLDSSSSYEWNSGAHYLINVTYGGETRSYGGAGNGEGQGISEDKIKKYFTFGTNGTKITLENSKQLLDDYAAVEMDDDIPREDALTWKKIYDDVGDGVWARLAGNVLGDTMPIGDKFAYFYQKGDGTYFNSDEWGVGYENYWGGDLGYARDAWVDGRYVNEWRYFVLGEKFEDHPTSDILLSNVAIPQITYDTDYKYNYDTGSYEYEYTNFKIEEKEKTVSFSYDQGEKIWKASYYAFDDNCAQYYTIAEFAEAGLIDKKYLDMVTLTPDEVKTLEVDKNTNTPLNDYLIYDGTTVPGMSLKNHTHNYGPWITKKAATCTAVGSKTRKCSVCSKAETATIAKTAHKYVNTVVKPTYTAQGYTLHECSVCGYSYKDNYTAKLTLPGVSGFKLGGRAADALRLNWAKNTSADGYIIEQYKDNKWVRIARIAGNATTTYRVTGLAGGTAYKFRMKAYKNGSPATYSSYTATLAARTNPNKVSGFVLGGRAADALRLNWTKNTSADGYIIEQYTGGKWVRIARIAGNSTTTYRIAGLKGSTAYKFRMKAYKMSGSTALYSGYTGTLSATTNPYAVSGFKIGGKAKTALRINWNKNTSAGGYIAEMYSGGKWVRIARISGNSMLTYRKAGLKANTTYKFRVRAYNMVDKTTALYGNYAYVNGTTLK